MIRPTAPGNPSLVVFELKAVPPALEPLSMPAKRTRPFAAKPAAWEPLKSQPVVEQQRKTAKRTLPVVAAQLVEREPLEPVLEQ